jgi:hypothetical protein
MPTFNLMLLLYVVTAVAIYARISMASAGTSLDDLIVRCGTLWILLCFGLLLHGWLPTGRNE